MKKVFTDTALTKWQRYSGHEKASIVYMLWLLILLLIVPLIKIDQINTTTSETFTIFNAIMAKTSALVLLCIAFLVAWNSSYRWKQALHKSFGFSGSHTITNAFVLFVILCMIFVIGDTVTLLNENFSYRIGTTGWYLIIGIFLIAGIVWQLVVTRLQWKKQMKSDSITVKSHTDDTKKERDFHQMEKEFQGLFEEESSRSSEE